MQLAMAQSNELAAIISKIGKTTILLSEKRVTLEEKMLRRYLHELAVIAAQLIADLHASIASGAKSETVLFSEIGVVSGEANTALDELLKVVSYNLNFLEQYFEHDFYDKLVNEYKFVDRFNALAKSLKQQSP